jgi:hypothetical protein
VPHRQVVLTIPKRLRAYCLYRRRLLGEIARVAARTVTAVPTVLDAREPVGRYANARQTVLARSAIASYTRRILGPARLDFLSRGAMRS